jgi:hypothetical protein
LWEACYTFVKTETIKWYKLNKAIKTNYVIITDKDNSSGLYGRDESDAKNNGEDRKIFGWV